MNDIDELFLDLSILAYFPLMKPNVFYLLNVDQETKRLWGDKQIRETLLFSSLMQNFSQTCPAPLMLF